MDVESGFAAAVVLVAVCVAAGFVAPSADPASQISFDAGVPDEYSFELPNASGTASVGGTTYTSLQEAVDAAESGDTVRLRGRFDANVTVNSSGIALVGDSRGAVINGNGSGDVLTVNADDVTVRNVWVRNSGYKASENHAAVWVNGTGVRVIDSRITQSTFGVWVDGVSGVVLRNNTVVGRESVTPLSYRGNGIQLWHTTDTVVENNRITDVRDGIYYSWSSDVVARGNTIWDLRYGVHYMYSDDCRLVDNVAFDNDVGYALMVSQRLEILNNTAVNNTGTSGHGVLVKSIDDTEIRDNSLVGNGRGVYVYNSLNNTIAGNLVLGNDVGVQLTAGSVRERVSRNSFVNNREAVKAVIGEQVVWNTSVGNYWSDATTVDLDNDGVSEMRYVPSGLVEHIVNRNPQAAAFSRSPAFDTVRLAESSVPVLESPGVVDERPLTRPTKDWRQYYESS